MLCTSALLFLLFITLCLLWWPDVWSLGYLSPSGFMPFTHLESFVLSLMGCSKQLVTENHIIIISGNRIQWKEQRQKKKNGNGSSWWWFQHLVLQNALNWTWFSNALAEWTFRHLVMLIFFSCIMFFLCEMLQQLNVPSFRCPLSVFRHFH